VQIILFSNGSTITLYKLFRFPPHKYKIIINDLQTGELIFCSGNYFYSKLIQKFTKSIWSQVGIIYKDEALDRILILESGKIYGVWFASLSKYLKNYRGKNKPYKGKIVVTRISPEIPITLSQNAISCGMDELTKPFDNWEIIRIIISLIFIIAKESTIKTTSAAN